jgi:hypothetical protein
VTEVIVAAIAALGSMCVAIVTVHGHRDLRGRLGQPNGEGNLIEINERQLRHQATLMEFAERSMENQEQTRSQLRKIDSAQDAHSLLDTRRFKDIFSHLDIPYTYQEEGTP